MQLLGWHNSGAEGRVCVMQSLLRIGLSSDTEIGSVVSESACRAPPACALLLLSKSPSSCRGGDPQKCAHTGICRSGTAQKAIRLWAITARSGPAPTQERPMRAVPLNLLRLSLLNSAPLAKKYHRDSMDCTPF